MRAVGRPHAVGGVSPHVVGGVRREIGDAAGERSRTSTVSGVAAGNGRILAGAPANAACRHICTAVGGYVAAAGGGSGCNVGDGAGGHSWGGAVYRHGDTLSAGAAVLVRTSHGVGGGGCRTDGDGGRGGVGAPSVAARAGGGERSAAAVVDGGSTVDADGYGVTSGGETSLRAVGRPHAVGGVCPYVVGGVRRKIGDAAGERPRAGAVGGVVAGDGRVLAGAPANAACRHICAAVGGYIAAAGGGSGRDVGDGACGDGRDDAVHRHGDTSGSGAAVLVRASHGVGGGGCRADGDGVSGGAGAPSVDVRAGGGERGAAAVADGGSAADADGHGIASGGETPLRAVGRSHAVGGVSPYIVGGVWREASDAAGETASTAAVGGMAVVNSGVLRGAPANAACRHICAAVGGYVTAAGGGGSRNVGDGIGGYGRQSVGGLDNVPNSLPHLTVSAVVFCLPTYSIMPGTSICRCENCICNQHIIVVMAAYVVSRW